MIVRCHNEHACTDACGTRGARVGEIAALVLQAKRLRRTSTRNVPFAIVTDLGCHVGVFEKAALVHAHMVYYVFGVRPVNTVVNQRANLLAFCIVRRFYHASVVSGGRLDIVRESIRD